MDDPHCDRVKLMRTYSQFKFVNRSFTGWKSIFKKYILPLLNEDRQFTLLDVGSGTMDVSLFLQKLVENEGKILHVTGIDPNDVTAELMAKTSLPPLAAYRNCYLSELIKDGESYDFVISNHLLHHLQQPEIVALLGEVELVTKKRAIMNDLSRSYISYIFFGALTLPIRKHSFLHIDGLRSIRRSYRVKEFESLGLKNWRFKSKFPFRVLGIHDACSSFNRTK
jgi:2-polyprenyl-3-methyl-5-hydroxy-6-metoxy-1,4-benzoquinol methylase